MPLIKLTSPTRPTRRVNTDLIQEIVDSDDGKRLFVYGINHPFILEGEQAAQLRAWWDDTSVQPATAANDVMRRMQAAIAIEEALERSHE